MVAYHCPLPLYHAARSGYLAVDAFFVLSGFVIAKTYMSRLTSMKELWPFMLRRIGRLFPMMAVGLICMLAVVNWRSLYLVAHGGTPSFFLPLGQILASLTFVSPLGLYHQLILNGPMWSAGVEFYTYVLFGAFAVLVRRRRRLVALAILLIAYLICAYGTLVVHRCAITRLCMDVTYDFGIFRCIAGFFLGYSAYEQAKSLRVMRMMSHSAPQVLLALVAVPYILYSFRIPALALSAPFFCFLVVISICADTGPLARVLSLRPFLWLGHISYSVYALDGPVQRLIWLLSQRPGLSKVFLQALYFLLVVGLGLLANRWIEDPARHWFATLSRKLAVRQHSNAVAPVA